MGAGDSAAALAATFAPTDSVSPAAPVSGDGNRLLASNLTRTALSRRSFVGAGRGALRTKTGIHRGAEPSPQLYGWAGSESPPVTNCTVHCLSGAAPCPPAQPTRGPAAPVSSPWLPVCAAFEVLPKVSVVCAGSRPLPGPTIAQAQSPAMEPAGRTRSPQEALGKTQAQSPDRPRCDPEERGVRLLRGRGHEG